MVKKVSYSRITQKQLNHMRRLLARRDRMIERDKVPQSYREIAELVGCSHTTVYNVAMGVTHNGS